MRKILNCDENPTACPGWMPAASRASRATNHALRRLEHRRSLDRVRETPHVIATPGRDLGYGVGAECTCEQQYTLWTAALNSASLSVMTNPYAIRGA